MRVIFGMRKPTLHPELVNMVKIGNASNLLLSISTNGSLLTISY